MFKKMFKKKEEPKKETSSNSFVACVLLDEEHIDFEQFQKDLKMIGILRMKMV